MIWRNWVASPEHRRQSPQGRRDGRPGGFVEAQHLADQAVEVEGATSGPAAGRIVAEIVHHPLHRLHLVDDGLGAALQHVGVAVPELVGKFELEALGGKLDGVRGFLISWARRRATSPQAGNCAGRRRGG